MPLFVVADARHWHAGSLRERLFKPIRRPNVTRANERGGRVLTLRVGRKVNDYYLLPIPCDEGAAFEVSKLQGDGQTYHVSLSQAGNTCECLGHLQHGHRTVCKHVASLVALRSAGR